MKGFVMQYRFEPVEGKLNCFRAVDKRTGKVFNVGKAITDLAKERERNALTGQREARKAI